MSTRKAARQRRARDAALLQATPRRARMRAASPGTRAFLPLPRHEDRRALRGQRAFHRRHRDPAWPVPCSANRISTARTRRKWKSARWSTRSTAASTGRGRSRRPPAISLGWSPEDGFLEYDWRGYNEAMLVYLLALGSPTHPGRRPRPGPSGPAPTTSHWGKHFGQEYLGFAPLFGHQYTHVWLDFRDVQDAYMRPARPRLLREHAAARSTRSRRTRSPIRGNARTMAR